MTDTFRFIIRAVDGPARTGQIETPRRPIRTPAFMLVCAFAGMDRMKKAYQHAIEAGYRFYSYGDACYLERHD